MNYSMFIHAIKKCSMTFMVVVVLLGISDLKSYTFRVCYNGSDDPFFRAPDIVSIKPVIQGTSGPCWPRFRIADFINDPQISIEGEDSENPPEFGANFSVMVNKGDSVDVETSNVVDFDPNAFGCLLIPETVNDGIGLGPVSHPATYKYTRTHGQEAAEGETWQIAMKNGTWQAEILDGRQKCTPFEPKVTKKPTILTNSQRKTLSDLMMSLSTDNVKKIEEVITKNEAEISKSLVIIEPKKLPLALPAPEITKDEEAIKALRQAITDKQLEGYVAKRENRKALAKLLTDINTIVPLLPAPVAPKTFKDMTRDEQKHYLKEFFAALDSNQDCEKIEQFLKNGVSPDAISQVGLCALNFVLDRTFTDDVYKTAQCLLKNHASPVRYWGTLGTAQSIQILSFHAEAPLELIAKHAARRMRDGSAYYKDEKTGMIKKMAKLLLDYGAGAEDFYPILLAARKTAKEMHNTEAQEVLQAFYEKMDFTIYDLFEAIINGTVEDVSLVLNKLEKKGVDLNVPHPITTTSTSETTPLVMAINQCKPEIVKVLLNRPNIKVDVYVDVTEQGQKLKRTPLQIAASIEKGSCPAIVEIVDLLLNADADVYKKEQGRPKDWLFRDTNMNAIEIAKAAGNQDVLEQLEKAAAAADKQKIK